ncbi:molybdopterin-containing oxidoreductase II, DMSO/TMAO/BSO reductase family, catalytic subunit [Campylobacter iguaniorum]|uniref:molybdopterin guanine dinucleotide-containing S/N-oxide reductase n=1 Tax=Campylobacter iguaniorum TaxID=1244531 RepID=UPI00073A468F|nr:molybdopterin guanine dinucleotide-containing S/N-oxide reductase [Campylobacter iguaniorum]ALV23633.1 molybdopterin-containing oxidoreductase II, DMSO/TMAO/BSO reductase family, catalytic subunit [Campylobacter iguaniorum]
MKTNNSRRSFLKAGAALSLAPLIPSSMFASPNTAIIKNGTVFTAAHWGMLKATVKNGKVISSQPHQITSKIPNPLQYTMPDLVYKTRIKAPMVRKSYLQNPDSPKPELRGIDEWVEVKYEDAIKLVARELKKTRKQKGSQSIFAGSYGWYSSGKFHNPRILLHRFMNLSGGFTGTLGDYSTGATQIIMPHVVGGIEVYEQQTSWPVVLESSKVVVMWGMNPISTLRIAWSSTDEQGFKYFEELKNSGKEIIIIDPVKSETAKYFSDKASWIAPVPNTDVAMMLSMAYHLYETKNYDKKFLEEYTIGFDKFLPYLLGQTDKTPKTPAWASQICGIDEKIIKELAIKFYKNRTMLMSGWGMQRAHHGEQPHWMLVTLASMLGQIGLPGGGFGLSYHYSNGGAPTCAGGVLGGINAASLGVIENNKFIGLANSSAVSNSASQSWLQKATDSAFPVARIADALLNPGKTIDHNGNKITYPDIDFIYWAGGNPLTQHQDTNTNIKAWRKPRTVVVNEIYWTPTAKMADIVFPVTSQYERNDLTMTGDYSNMDIAPIKQVVEKQNGAKDDYQVFSDLCKAYADGLVEVYTANGKTEMDWLEEFYNVAANAVNANVALGVSMPKFDEWWNKNEPTTFAPTMESSSWVRFGEFREDPILNALGTPSGLIEIYSDTIEAMKYDDCAAYPKWFEPVEWLGMKDKPAKFHMLSVHPTDRLHSQQNNTSLRENYAVAGREPITINPKDAKDIGVKTGDLVRVYNKRGEVLAGVVVSDEIRQGVVRLREGAWYDGFDSKVCKNGCANVLTMDIPTSKLANGNISHTTLVNIELYKGKALGLDAFKAPKGAK